MVARPLKASLTAAAISEVLSILSGNKRNSCQLSTVNAVKTLAGRPVGLQKGRSPEHRK